jgi:hypothetical protein
MSVVKLNESHVNMVDSVFQLSKYMGLPVTPEFNEILLDRFKNTYLCGLNKFHAYGYEQDGEIKALISFYESDEEPAWYYTLYRSLGNNELLRHVLDAVIAHNESLGRLKFYTLVHSSHSKLLRRFHWSKYNNERYDYFDECMIPSKNKSIYTNHWELLFKRALLTEDSIVRCNFLKQEYRTSLPLGGNI